MENKQDILQLLQQVSQGDCSPQQALLQLKQAPFEDLGYAKVDFHRSIRQGSAEVIYGAGKTTDQILGIAKKMGQEGCKNILITRISAQTAEDLGQNLPLQYHPQAKIAVAFASPVAQYGNIVVVTGGTSDIPVAEEAAITAETLGNRVVRLYDVGVAGIHRLLAYQKQLMSARCVVAVAGMEGALASVVGGLVDCPVIAVPTSIGYGANLGGLAALLSMLNSCASGCSVVNIDNGFGAGYLASRINQMKTAEDCK